MTGRGRSFAIEVQPEAARLRLNGVGRADVARRIGVSMSTVCRWFREDGVPMPVAYRGATRAQQEAVVERWPRQQTEQDEHRDAVGALTQRELFLIGVALYWSEGAKSKPWNRSHVLSFCNSDTTMICVYLAWLDLLGVAHEQVRCSVSIHESADVKSAERHWGRVLGPSRALGWTSLKRHVPTTRRKNVGEAYRGCLTVRVRQGAGLYRRVAGAWEGIALATTPVASARLVPRSPVV